MPKTSIVKRKIGRPTKYTPETINKINEYIEEAIPQNMKIPTVEGIALKLGISKETLYQWAKKRPEFSDALAELKMKQKECLTEIGIFGGKEINASIVQLLLKINHGMTESTPLASNVENMQVNFISHDGRKIN